MRAGNDREVPLLFYNYKENMNLTMKTQGEKTALSHSSCLRRPIPLRLPCTVLWAFHCWKQPWKLLSFFPSFHRTSWIFQRGLTHTHPLREAGEGVREVSTFPKLHMGVPNTGYCAGFVWWINLNFPSCLHTDQGFLCHGLEIVCSHYCFLKGLWIYFSL